MGDSGLDRASEPALPTAHTPLLEAVKAVTPTSPSSSNTSISIGDRSSSLNALQAPNVNRIALVKINFMSAKESESDECQVSIELPVTANSRICAKACPAKHSSNTKE